MMRGLIVTLTAVAALACTDRKAPQSHVPVAIRDSAGVRVVEYAELPSDTIAPIHVASTPTYRVGWQAGGPEWTAVTSGALFPDGRAALLDIGDETVTILDPAGTLT